MKPKTLLVVSITSTAPGKAEEIIERLSSTLRSHRHLLILRPNGPITRTENTTILAPAADLGVGALQKIGFQFAEKESYEIVCQLFDELLPGQLELEAQLTRFEESVGIKALYATRASSGNLSHEVGRHALRLMHNALVGIPLHDLHSAYRLYKTAEVVAVPYDQNSDGRMFLIELSMQLVAAGVEIQEFRSLTSVRQRPNMVRYGWKIFKLAVLQRVQRLGIFYDSRFDLMKQNVHYVSKFDFLSSHSLALDNTRQNERLLLLGSGPAELVGPFCKKTSQIFAMDQFVEPELEALCVSSESCNLDEVKTFDRAGWSEPFDAVYALDIIEHLHSPEAFLAALRNSHTTANARLVLTTPNIAFLPVRLMLLLGQFNYGKRGILDRTHTRLFTFRSLARLLEQQGFRVEILQGVPAPFPLAVGRNWFGRFLIQANLFFIRLSRGMFSFQILTQAVPLPTATELLRRAETGEEKIQSVAW